MENTNAAALSVEVANETPNSGELRTSDELKVELKRMAETQERLPFTTGGILVELIDNRGEALKDITKELGLERSQGRLSRLHNVAKFFTPELRDDSLPFADYEKLWSIDKRLRQDLIRHGVPEGEIKQMDKAAMIASVKAARQQNEESGVGRGKNKAATGQHSPTRHVSEFYRKQYKDRIVPADFSKSTEFLNRCYNKANAYILKEMLKRNIKADVIHIDGPYALYHRPSGRLNSGSSARGVICANDTTKKAIKVTVDDLISAAKVLADNGIIILWANGKRPLHWKIAKAAEVDAGLEPVTFIPWIKDHYQIEGEAEGWHTQIEACYIFCKKGTKPWCYKDGFFQGNYWFGNRRVRHSSETVEDTHEMQKPDSMMDLIVEMYLPDGGLACDLFACTGSLTRAILRANAKGRKINWIMSEIKKVNYDRAMFLIGREQTERASLQSTNASAAPGADVNDELSIGLVARADAA